MFETPALQLHKKEVMIFDETEPAVLEIVLKK